MDDKLVPAYIDLELGNARDPLLRPQYEAELKEQLVNEIPQMVSRLAQLEPIMTVEVGEHIDFVREAVLAFQFGLWRAVVALIGIAAESFTDTLYGHVKYVTSSNGIKVRKDELFGRDDSMPEKRKLTVLFVFGIIEREDYTRLKQIKELRDEYVHPKGKAKNIEQDAKKIMSLFQTIINERSERTFRK